jgi:hypothetical protein
MPMTDEIRKALTEWMKQFEPGGFLGWAFRQSGGKKWLRERAIHAPQSIVITLAERRRVVQAELQQKYPFLTQVEAEWRSFEATVCEAIEQKIVKDIEGNLPALPIPGWKP